ncbi:MAG: arginase [Bacteroidetes bacterium]|mgnify:FL=1|nr:arginase [Bacteroidota bacterium]
MNRDVVIVENPSEVGAGARGAGTGPFAVRLQDNETGNKVYGKFPHLTVDTFNGALCNPITTPNAKYINEIVEQNNRLIGRIQPLLDAGKFPFILSGDHSNALGTIAAIKDHNPSKRLGVIWIDAHADLHTPYTTPSGNVHGMPLGASLGEGYESNAINEPNVEVVNSWHALTHMGKNQIHPKVDPKDLALIAIRDLEDAEWNDIDDNNIFNYVPARLLNKTMEQVAAETLEYLEDCDLIYISFDVDSMDPSVSVGTGTSVPNGLTLENAKSLLEQLYKSPKITALEITEINPLIDQNNKMAKAALDIMHHLLV